MRIKKIHLENFSGIEDLTVDLSGRSANIYAPSGHGKTAIANAITWVLCGCAMNESENFRAFTFNNEGYWGRADITFAVEGGQVVTLGKSGYEKYKAPRYHHQYILREVEAYFINYEEVPAHTFYTIIKEITKCSREELKTLLVWEHVWKMVMPIRRTVITKLFPEVTDDEIVVIEPEVDTFITAIEGTGMDAVAWNQLSKLRIKALMYEKRRIRNFINELISELPNFDTESENDIHEEIKKCKTDIREATKLLAVCEDTDTVKGIDTEIRSIRAKVGNRELEYCRESKLANQKKEVVVNKKTVKLKKTIEKIGISKGRIAKLSVDIERKERKHQPEDIINSLKAKRENEKNVLARLERKRTKLADEIETIKMTYVPIPDYSQTMEFAVFKAKIDRCYEVREYTIANEEATLQEFIAIQKELIENAIGRLDELKKGEGKEQLIVRMIKQHAACIAEYETTKELRKLCWYYILAKGKLMNERMEKLCPTLRFSFFTVLSNGVMVEDCTPQVLSNKNSFIPFDLAGVGEKERAQLEMAVALRKFYNIDLPIIIDNAVESTDSWNEQYQVIRLIHSDKQNGNEGEISNDGTKQGNKPTPVYL